MVAARGLLAADLESLVRAPLSSTALRRDVLPRSFDLLRARLVLHRHADHNLHTKMGYLPRFADGSRSDAITNYAAMNCTVCDNLGNRSTNRGNVGMRLSSSFAC